MESNKGILNLDESDGEEQFFDLNKIYFYEQATSDNTSSNTNSSWSDEDNIDDDEVTRPAEDNDKEIDQDPLVYEGMIFESQEGAYKTYNKYAGNMGFSVRKSKMYRRANGTVRCRIFVCYKQGFKVNRLDRCVQKERRQIRTGCMARMMIKHQKDDEWIASEIITKHNHPLATPKKKYMRRSQRILEEVHKSEIESLNNVGIQPVDGYDYMVQQAGGHASRGITHVDYKNYLRKKRLEELGVGDANAILNYFTRKKSENPGFFSAIMVDDENQLTNFFWADAMSIIDYHHFGDVVVFDTTYRTNKYGRPFAPFVGVNHHKQTVIFGGALLIDETVASFVWLFRTWMKAMSGKKPKTILTDQCPSMAKAISIVLPETRHRLCLWHIFQNAAKHLSQVYKNPSFSQAFNNCIYNCETEEEFLGEWQKMLQEFDLLQNDWLNGLFNIRQKWILVYGRDTFCADMTTTQRSESINSFLKLFVKRKYGLKEFCKNFEKALATRRQTELEEDFRTIKTVANLFVPTIMLKQVADLYTPAIFELFEYEYKAHLMCKLEIRASEGTTYEFELTQESRRERFVKIDTSNSEAVCSCKKFDFAGIPCRHLIKVFHHCNIHEIPAHYILKRWTKDAKKGLVHDQSHNTIQADCNADVSLRYNDLCRMAVNFAMKGAISEDVNLLAKKLLNDATKQIEAAITVSQTTSSRSDPKPKDLMHPPNNPTVAEVTYTVAKGNEKGRPSGGRLKNCLEQGSRKKASKTNGTVQKGQVDKVPVGDNQTNMLPKPMKRKYVRKGKLDKVLNEVQRYDPPRPPKNPKAAVPPSMVQQFGTHAHLQPPHYSNMQPSASVLDQCHFSNLMFDDSQLSSIHRPLLPLLHGDLQQYSNNLTSEINKEFAREMHLSPRRKLVFNNNQDMRFGAAVD